VTLAVLLTLVTVAVATGDERPSAFPPGLAPPAFAERGAPAAVEGPEPPSPPVMVTTGPVPMFGSATDGSGIRRRAASPPAAVSGGDAPVPCLCAPADGGESGATETSSERGPRRTPPGHADDEWAGVPSPDERPARGARQE
jgi:hypothetical protein